MLILDNDHIDKHLNRTQELILEGGTFMPNPPSQHMDSDWRSLFRAVMIEKDCRLIEKRICDAEQAIVARSIELFRQTGLDAAVERELLNDAVYTVHL